MKHSTDLRQAKRQSAQPSNLAVFASFIILIFLILLSFCFGSYSIDFGSIFSGTMSTKVFFGLRLPRVLSSALVGGVLGVTGAVCQIIFSNSLASPDITGVASGASFGAAVAILLGLSSLGRVCFAFAFGLLALLILIFLVKISRRHVAEDKTRYLLAGILISSLAEAGVMVIKSVADPERQLAAIEYWTMGSFSAITMDKFLMMSIFTLPALVLLIVFKKQALILSRGREASLSLGVSPSFWQPLLLVLVTWAVAGAVSMVGVIGFVGLIVPHMALAIIKSRGKMFYTLCFIIGSIITVISDLFARTLFGTELPVSIFCVGFAVIWFTFLFVRGKTIGGN